MPWVKLIWLLYGPGAHHAQVYLGGGMFLAFEISTIVLLTTPSDGASILLRKHFWSNREILADKFNCPFFSPSIKMPQFKDPLSAATTYIFCLKLYHQT